MQVKRLLCFLDFALPVCGVIVVREKHPQDDHIVYTKDISETLSARVDLSNAERSELLDLSTKFVLSLPDSQFIHFLHPGKVQYDDYMQIPPPINGMDEDRVLNVSNQIRRVTAIYGVPCHPLSYPGYVRKYLDPWEAIAEHDVELTSITEILQVKPDQLFELGRDKTHFPTQVACNLAIHFNNRRPLTERLEIFVHAASASHCCSIPGSPDQSKSIVKFIKTPETCPIKEDDQESEEEKVSWIWFFVRQVWKIILDMVHSIRSFFEGPGTKLAQYNQSLQSFFATGRSNKLIKSFRRWMLPICRAVKTRNCSIISRPRNWLAFLDTQLVSEEQQGFWSECRRFTRFMQIILGGISIPTASAERTISIGNEIEESLGYYALNGQCPVHSHTDGSRRSGSQWEDHGEDGDILGKCICHYHY